jgi:hypothetical protein
MKIIDYTEFPINVLVEDPNGLKDIIRFRIMSKNNGEALWFGASSECACYAFIDSNNEYCFKPVTLSTDIVTTIPQFKKKLWKN